MEHYHPPPGFFRIYTPVQYHDYSSSSRYLSPGRGEGFPKFSEEFPSRFFRVPCLGFPLYGRRFYRGWKIIIPLWILFRIPGCIWAQQKSSRLCAHRSVVRAIPVEVFWGGCVVVVWVLVRLTRHFLFFSGSELFCSVFWNTDFLPPFFPFS